MTVQFTWSVVTPIEGGAYTRRWVTPRHVSRETLNRPSRTHRLVFRALRDTRKELRRRRMRLRKLRGWR